MVDGPDLKLVNLSRGGALVESPSRYPMRSAIQLALTRASGTVTVKTATVSWAQVASIVEMRISYLLAFSFDTPIADFEAATGISDLEVPADEGAAQDQPAGDPIDASDADLREQLAAAMARIAEHATATQALVTRLEAVDAERTNLQAEIARQRQRAVQPQVRTEAADAVTRTAALDRALAERERAHQQAMAEARAGYEALVSELMDVANAQEVEFQRLLAEQTARRDQEYARAEYTAAELARLRAAGTRALADWDKSGRNSPDAWSTPRRAALPTRSGSRQWREKPRTDGRRFGDDCTGAD